MQSIGTVVLGYVIGFAIKRKSAICNTVRVTSDDRTDIRRIWNIAFEILVAQSHIRELAFAVRDADGKNDAAIIHRVHFDTVRIGQRVQGDGPPILRAKRFLLHCLLMSFAGLREDDSADHHA